MMQDKNKIAEYDRLAAENSELKSELENLRKQIACLKKLCTARNPRRRKLFCNRQIKARI